MKIGKTKEIVAKLLLKYPSYRDNDLKLIAHVWWEQIENDDLWTIEERDIIKFFLKEFSNGNLIHPESIRRSRQKLQEMNKFLQGPKYWEKHNIAVAQMEAELFGKEFKISEVKF